jgi:LEA14-like dessication related protein
MLIPLRTASIVVCFCFVSIGCSSIQKPTASLKSADIGAVAADGFTVNFDLDVKNPNSFVLPLAETDYGLSLGGVKLVKDTLKPSGSIPAGGSTAVTIPVKLDFDDLLKAEKAIRAGGGDVPYEFDAALGFSGGSAAGGLSSLGMPTKVPLHYSGTLPLRKVLSDPTVLMNSPAARKLAGKGLESILKR